MVVMPALFAFGFASEDRLVHRMREVANETEHALQTAEWAERERQRKIGLEKESTTKLMYVWKNQCSYICYRFVPFERWCDISFQKKRHLANSRFFLRIFSNHIAFSTG